MTLGDLGRLFKKRASKCGCQEWGRKTRCHHAYETCTGNMVLRRGDAGKLFWGCSKWPECSNTAPFTIFDIPVEARKLLLGD